MYLVLVFLPLIGSILAGFGGHWLGPKGSCFITTCLLFITFCLSFTCFCQIGLGFADPVHLIVSPWIESAYFRVNWGFYFDSLTVTILVVVTSVSTLVHFYSIEYMNGDPHHSRFIAYLSLFTFFMLILVTGDNLVQLFVGWEGVGLSSYLLINFWFTRIQANKAAIKAILVNRVGDLGLALGIIACFYFFGTVEYQSLFGVVSMFSESIINYPVHFLFFSVDAFTLVSILLFIGAVGKSAQLGLHTWLPDAMEGPTPVSALIHAATMVTAGVFLIARCSPIFEQSSFALQVVTLFGAITAFFAATTGLVQNDIKRVIAYSTCSQLGYIVFACGLSAYNVGVFHLANHAFFKALLFLSAGSVIHALSDEQDMRKIGGLVRLLPITYAIVFIGSISLIGFPFITGFYSKDCIIEVAYGSFSTVGHFAHWLGCLGAFFTAFYSIRLLYMVFLAETNSPLKLVSKVHDSNIFMGLPLIILCFGSIFIGWVLKDLMIGLGTPFWGNAIFMLPKNEPIILAEFAVPTFIKLVPVLLSLLGGFLSFSFYLSMTSTLFSWKTQTFFGFSLYQFLNRKWYFDKVYNEFLVQPCLNFGYFTSYKLLDRGLIELFGPHGFSSIFYSWAKVFSRFQTGFIYHYLFVFLLSVSVFGVFIIILCYEIFFSKTPFSLG